jgi:hypothetical protein
MFGAPNAAPTNKQLRIDRTATRKDISDIIARTHVANALKSIGSRRFVLKIITLTCALLTALVTAGAQSPERWKIHDMSRPRPAKVTSHMQLPVPAPSDAVVLFDGEDMSKWRAAGGGDAKWIVKNGNMEAVAGGGPVFTRQGFGDIQLHLEWAAPTPGRGKSQGRGNSGVFLMSRYEIQILDSYENVTYTDGQAGALYGQYPPLVNPSRPEGEWQAYDIIFRRPRFKPDGSVMSAARVTLLHNGIVVQDGSEYWGPTAWLQHNPYESHPDRLPIYLQDHGNPVLYRNIWLRELDEEPRKGPTTRQTKPLVSFSPEYLDRYVGEYKEPRGGVNKVFRKGETLFVTFNLLRPIELLAHSKEEFSLRWTGAKIVFDLDGNNDPTGMTFHIGGEERKSKRQ